MSSTVLSNFRQLTAVLFGCLIAASSYLDAALIVTTTGERVEADSVRYANGEFITADGKQLPGDTVSSVFLTVPNAPDTGQESADTPARASGDLSAALPPETLALVERARQLAASHPGCGGVHIIDHGEDYLRRDGTRVYRYHFLGLALNEDKRNAWRSVRAGYEDGRSVTRFIMARSIAPDGAIYPLDLSTMTVSTPKESDGFINKRARVISGEIPGVVIGSLIEYVREWELKVPEMKRMVCPGWGFQSDIPVVSSRFVIDLPDPLDGELEGLRLQWLGLNLPDGASEPLIEKADGRARYIWHIENVAPLVNEPDMVADENVLMRLESTLYPDWNELMTYYARIQTDRIVVTPEISNLAQSLTFGITNFDDKVAKLYHWVQQNITYNSIKSSRSSGWSGHPAQETLDKKFGDCTDVSILFVALCKAVDVEAYPIYVKTSDAGESVVELPLPDSNHCISQIIRPDGSKQYLDCTSDSYRYPYFRADDHGVWAINAQKNEIERTPVPPPSDNLKASRTEFVLDADLNATVKEINEYNGSYEAGVRGYWRSVPAERRSQTMQRYISSRFPNAVLNGFELTDVNDLKTPLMMTLNYTAPRIGERAGEFAIVQIGGLEWNFGAQTALETRQHPIDHNTTRAHQREWTYRLPDGFAVETLPEPLVIDSPHIAYQASMSSIDDGRAVFVSERFSIRSRIIPAVDYPEYRRDLNRIARWSKNHLFLKSRD